MILTTFDAFFPMSILNLGVHYSVLAGHFVKAKGIHKTWKTIELMTHEFRDHWLKIYLRTLIPHKKWSKAKQNVQIGDLVYETCIERLEIDLSFFVC